MSNRPHLMWDGIGARRRLLPTCSCGRATVWLDEHNTYYFWLGRAHAASIINTSYYSGDHGRRLERTTRKNAWNAWRWCVFFCLLVQAHNRTLKMFYIVAPVSFPPATHFDGFE